MENQQFFFVAHVTHVCEIHPLLDMCGRDIHSLKLTAIAPENRPGLKIVFQPSILRGELLVLGSCIICEIS